jgi:hypothetical protein
VIFRGSSPAAVKCESDRNNTHSRRASEPIGAAAGIRSRIANICHFVSAALRYAACEPPTPTHFSNCLQLEDRPLMPPHPDH